MIIGFNSYKIALSDCYKVSKLLLSQTRSTSWASDSVWRSALSLKSPYDPCCSFHKGQ